MAITISDIELSVQRGLEALRDLPFNEQIALTMQYLVPKGYRPVIQLEEDGRKKRSNASPDSWNPETGEVVIYFERILPELTGSAGTPVTKASSPKPTIEIAPVENTWVAGSGSPQRAPGLEPPQASSEGPPTETEITQCCQALAEAEKAGKLFIALKWFRDDLLPTTDFNWVKSPQRRHLILTAAIDSGKITTKKRQNPKAPDFPTTVVVLNQEVQIPGVLPRFRPVPVHGEPASVTLMRDRGSY